MSVDERDPEGEGPDDRVGEGDLPESLDTQPEDPDYPGRESPEAVE